MTAFLIWLSLCLGFGGCVLLKMLNKGEHPVVAISVGVFFGMTGALASAIAIWILGVVPIALINIMLGNS